MKCICISLALMVFGMVGTAFGENVDPVLSSPVRILIGSVLNHEPNIMKEFFQSLNRLHLSNARVDYYFVNEKDEAVANDLIGMLQREETSTCRLINPHEASPSPCTYIWKLADFKEYMINIARQQHYDYIFLVDSNIVLHPKTLEQLLDVKKEIVANIFWTFFDQRAVPQVWLSDFRIQYEIVGLERLSNEEINRRRDEFFNRLKIPGTYQVGGLGACTLISKEALAKGVSFRRIKNVSFYSEDCHFCLRAEALGIPLFVDTHYPAYIIIRDTGESSLEGAVAFNESSERSLMLAH